MYLVLPVCIVISDVIGVPPQREEAHQREEALGGRTHPAPETFKKLGLVWGRWAGDERGRWVAEGWRRLGGWSRRRLAPWTIVA